MQAIRTRYLGPTTHRGSRIKATCDGGSLTIGYNTAERAAGGDEHGVDTVDIHWIAAKALRDRLGWTGDMVGGYLHGGGYAFVFIGAQVDEQAALIAALTGPTSGDTARRLAPATVENLHAAGYRVAYGR